MDKIHIHDDHNWEGRTHCTEGSRETQRHAEYFLSEVTKDKDTMEALPQKSNVHR